MQLFFFRQNPDADRGYARSDAPETAGSTRYVFKDAAR